MTPTPRQPNTSADSQRGRAGRHTAASRRAFAPRLDVFEDRTLLSAAPITVMNLNDSGNGSLRAALADAVDGTTITFAPRLHGTLTLTSGELVIAAGVTIDGPGANQLTVSGGGKSRVFELTEAGANVTIDGLTVADGRAVDTGGGILNDGANLSLSGDVLTRNVVTEGTSTGGRGGGLYGAGGTVTVANSAITGNQALGGVGPSEYGAAFGGGLCLRDGAGLTITDSTVSGNLSQGGAGSYYGDTSGGGVSSNGPITITGAVFACNESIGGNGGTGSFAGQATSGAIQEAGAAAFSVSDSSFSGNEAIGGNGGSGEYCDEGLGGAIASSGTMTITGCSFNGNASLGGSNGQSTNATADPFIDYAFGGAVANTAGTAIVTASSFTNNRAVGGNGGTAVGTDIVGVGGAEGGAFYSEVDATTNLNGCTFVANEAIGGNGDSGTGPVILVGEGLGGAIVSGYDSNPPTAALTVANNLIASNTAQGGNHDTGAVVPGGVFGLVGAGVGGGIANYAGGTANVTDSQLLGNQAIGGNGANATGTGAIAGGGAGGAVASLFGNYNSPAYGDFGTSTVTVTGCVVAYNDAEADHGAALGGGIYGDATSSLALFSTDVLLNSADGRPGIGGGVYSVGTFSSGGFTIIALNSASTHDNNVGP